MFAFLAPVIEWLIGFFVGRHDSAQVQIGELKQQEQDLTTLQKQEEVANEAQNSVNSVTDTDIVNLLRKEYGPKQ